jgi:hypothetical protein
MTDDTADEYTPSSNGVWAGLRKQHQAISKAHTPLLLELPDPYDGVWVRYRYVAVAERKGSMKKIAALDDESEQGFWASVDLLRDACDEILVANPDDPRADDTGLAPLCDPGEPPIKFDRALARGMEWSDAHLLSARQIVRRMFGDQEGDYLLLEQAKAVGKWMGAERDEIAEEFAGK